MASKKVRVIVEFPEGMELLSRKEAEQVRNALRSELATVVDPEDQTSVAYLEFENVTNPPGGGHRGGKKVVSKTGVKKGAAKSSKKR